MLDEFLHLLRIFGLLGWDATTKFTTPVMEIRKSRRKKQGRKARYLLFLPPAVSRFSLAECNAVAVSYATRIRLMNGH